jgi:hypothetical protein
LPLARFVFAWVGLTIITFGSRLITLVVTCNVGRIKRHMVRKKLVLEFGR